jgi:hypothetical protein
MNMYPASVGIARESCLLRSDVPAVWTHPSACAHSKNVGRHPLFHESLQLRVLGCDPRLHKVRFAHFIPRLHAL